MSQVQTQYKNAIKSYITRHEPEIFEHFELTMNTVKHGGSGTATRCDREFEEDPDSNDQPNAAPPDSENNNEAQKWEGDNASE